MSGRELRIALGMRGGVSLAVWIGGANAEIDTLRRAGGAGDRGLWSRLRAEAGYDTVVVDVMAGASAGGLNGVLFAASQVHDFPMAAMRELWVDVADTTKLRRTGGPWLSLFEGDDYFFDEIERALERLIGDRPAPPDPPRLDLRLSATLVEPITRHVPSPSDERLLERRYSSGFRFRSPPYTWLDTDFPPAGEQRRANLSRLALAGRATSSYPGAFEAASVRSRRATSFGKGAVALEAGVAVEMCGILVDRRQAGAAPGSDRFVLADGGILDNIPLGLALEAVGEAPAEGPTDRYLVYLHPGAPSTRKPTKQVDELTRRSSPSVIRATILSRVSGEDIRGDIAELESHNDAIERAATIRRSTFEPLDSDDELCKVAERWRGSYSLARVGEDVRLITDLLADPIGALREDPFPAAVGTSPPQRVSDDRWRAPLQEPPLQQIGELTSTLTRLFTERLHGWEAARGKPETVFEIGARPLLRLTQTLLEWCVALEAIEGVALPSPASAEKALLYRVNTFVRVAIDRPRQLGWVAIAAAAPTTITPSGATEPRDTRASDLAGPAMRALDVLLDRSDDEIDAITAALARPDDGGSGVLRAAVEDSVARIDRAVDVAWLGAEHESSGDNDLRTAIVRDVLVPIVQRLQPSASRYSASPSSPAWFLNRVLSSASAKQLPAVFAALEVMCFPEYAAGAPGRRPTRFVRLSAANPTPLAPHFTKLLGDARSTGLWWDPDNTVDRAQQGIHVALKLAGNELANFSAFLRPEWRANDWMWGSLDAVPTLVELLTPERVLRKFAAKPNLLKDLVTGGTTAEWQAFLGTHAWAPFADEISKELAAVPQAADGTTPKALAIGKALTARRQFELLAQLVCDDPAVPPDLEVIADYRVGAETIRDPQLRTTMQRKLNELTDAFGPVAVESVQRSDLTLFGTPDRTNLKGKLARFGLRRAGRALGRRLTRPL